MAYYPLYQQAYGPYGSGATVPAGTITPGGTIGTPGILPLTTTGMANSIRSTATVTGSLPVEAALVKDATGAAISSPAYADCLFDSASGKWICDTAAPAGTYGPASQLMRLKGSNPAVTAGSLGTVTVAGSGTGPSAPTFSQPTTTSSTITPSWTGPSGTYTLQRAPVANGVPGTFTTVYTGTTASYQDGPLTFNTPYAYRVKVTVNGVDSAYSAVLQVSTAAGSAFGDLQIDTNRLASFIPASSTAPTDYQYQFTPDGSTASGYNALPMPSVSSGRVRFTLTGNTAGTLQVRRTSQPGVVLSVPVATYAGKLLSFNAEGDSLSANAARNGFTWSWFNQLQTALASDPTFIGFNNYATGGDPLTDMANAANKAQVQAGYNTDPGVINILSLLGAINDFQFGRSVQDTLLALKSLVQYYVAAGYSVVIYTITTSRLPGSNYDHMAFWLKIQELNERVKAAFNAGDIPATVLCDLQTNPYLGGYDAPLNRDYFETDQIHYSEAGARQVRDFILRAIPYLRSGTRMHLTYTQDLVATPGYAPVGATLRETDYAYYSSTFPDWGAYANGAPAVFKAPTTLQSRDTSTTPVYVRFVSDGTNVIRYTAPRYGTASAKLDLLLDGNFLTTINFASGGGTVGFSDLYVSGPIPAGQHILTLKPQGDGGVFFDEISTAP